MKRLSSVLGWCFAGILLASLPLAAQVRGIPASVTSYDFGGHTNRTPGIPASVTSLGPQGYGTQHRGVQTPCCFVSQVPPQRHPGNGHQHRGQSPVGYNPYYYGSVYYAMPYPVYTVPQAEEPAPAEPSQQFPEEEYRGGPTIFDRRGPGTARLQEPAPEPEPAHEPLAPREPEADQPNTLLVFKDGHQLEVQNYAIVGDTLLDMSEGHRRKVPLAELDVEATAKQNDERGIDFRLPVKPQAN